MKIASQLAGIAGIWCLVPALFCLQQSPSGRNAGAPFSGPMRVQHVPAGLRADQASQKAARKKAEELEQEARGLSLKQLRADFEASIFLFQESALQFQIAGLPERAAEITLEMAGIAFILSRYPQALEAYHDALQLTKADETRCRVLARMARTYSNTGRNLEAMRYSGQAVSLCETLPDSRAKAEGYEARGEALYSSSDHLQAIEQFKLALALFETNDPSRALALLMLAEVRFEKGGEDEKKEAIRLALEALQLWSSTGDQDGVAQARATLGIFSMTAGQFETARCHCEKAQEIFNTLGDEDHRAKALNTLGSTSLAMGNPEDALKYWVQTQDAYHRFGDRLGEASAITSRGKALLALHRNHELPQLFQTELDLAKKAASKSMEASARADIAGVEALNRQYQRAEGNYLQAVEIYHSLGLTNDESDVLTLLGEFYTRQGKYKLATSPLERALAIQEKNDQVEDKARIHYDLAYVYWKLGRLEDASAAVQHAIPIIEKQRSMIREFDSRASYFAAVHNYYALHINLLMLRRDRHDEFAVQAFEAAERSKVRSLIDWLVESDQGASCDALWRRQAEEILKAAPTAGFLPQKNEEQSLSPVTLRQAQALIKGDNAILLEYALGDEKSYMWAITENEIFSYELPNAKKLSSLVQRLREAVTAPGKPKPGESNDDEVKRLAKSEQDYKRYSWGLSQLLLSPVPLRGNKRIIVVPEGPLQHVPFSALPLRDANGRSLILADQHEVIILPSASALAAIRKGAENKPRPPLPVAVFADPVFERDDARAYRVNPSNRSPLAEATECEKDIQHIRGAAHIPRLPGTHREAQAVEQYLSKTGKKALVAEGYQASRKTLFPLDLGAYRLLVFATHSFVDGENPEKSMILLSLLNQSGAIQNGCIRLRDINKFKLSADLVVLSSCESALGKELPSEGVIGLSRSFLRVGARSIIATLWEVDDYATADLMTRFYYHLHLGESPASALRNAQRDIRADKRWSKEYFWAGFFLQGDYKIGSLN